MTAAPEKKRDSQRGHRHDLSEVMNRLARQLQEEHGDVEATLRAVTTAAVRIVSAVEECGITYVIGRSKLASRAWTGDLPKDVDKLQERLGEGPCIDAVWEQEFVRVDDMPSEQRWPRFSREAARLGVGSMLCFQLFVEGDQLGAMNLYARSADAFDDESQETGAMLAAHAAVALAGAQHEEHLRAGLANRDAIGQAKGILMERYKVTGDQAFGLLVRASSLTNRKLRDLADELTTTGHLPVR